MPIDPVSSALDAIVAYFGTVSGIAAVLRGWPEHGVDLDLTSGPVISIDSEVGPARRMDCSPAPVNDAPPFLYRYGWLRISAQLDLWAAYRAQRDDAGAIVERALHNQLQFGRPDLYLTTSDYYGRLLTVSADDIQSVAENQAATEGVWRRTWALTISTDLVGETTTPATSEIVLRDDDGDHSIT